MGDVGNIIFTKKSDDVRPWNALAPHERNARLDGATLRWERNGLIAQGDFWDSRFGDDPNASTVPANMRVNITSISTHDMKDGRTIIELTVNVSGIDHLKNLIQRIEKVDGILSVER